MSYLGLVTVKPTKPMKRGDLYSFPVTTVDQIITDEDTNERLPEYLDNLTGIDLLWTNASPTSRFNEQTISLDLSGYSAVEVEMREGTNADVRMVFKVNKGTTVRGLLMYNVRQTRNITVTDTGVKFAGGNAGQYNASMSSSNDALIPVRIWGVK